MMYWKTKRWCLVPGSAMVLVVLLLAGSAPAATDCDTEPDADGDAHRAVECGGDDCDDSDPRRFPGNAEVCDEDHVDEDCDPFTFGNRDEDVDGFVDSSCCNEQPDGSFRCGPDCDDSMAGVHPIQNESCNDIDDDCNGLIDEGVTVLAFRDGDADGYGDATVTPDSECADTPGFSPLGNDCDDTNPAIGPGAMMCDSQDPSIILVCNAEGDFDAAPCRGRCVTHPNGTGTCQAGRASQSQGKR